MLQCTVDLYACTLTPFHCIALRILLTSFITNNAFNVVTFTPCAVWFGPSNFCPAFSPDRFKRKIITNLNICSIVLYFHHSSICSFMKSLPLMHSFGFAGCSLHCAAWDTISEQIKGETIRPSCRGRSQSRF